MKFKYGSFSVVGGRSYQEDRILIDINDEVSGLYIDFDANVNFIRHFFKDGKKPKYVFGIFDGHGGSEISEYLSNNFCSLLYQHKKIEYQSLLSFQETWHSFDEKCYSECLRLQRGKNLAALPSAGSTATVCFICDDDIFVLNCGDSSAYCIMSDDSVQLLTEDHGTKNADEIKRCTHAGGYLMKQTAPRMRAFPLCCWTYQAEIGKDRICPGNLLVTR